MTELLTITNRLNHPQPGTPTNDTLSLPFSKREKCRQRIRLESGREAGLFLPRGIVLRDGDILESENGLCIRVKAADETVSSAIIEDRRLFALIAYHLGNRHVPVRIEENRIIWLHDHVLDDMVRQLGADVCVETGPFEPEDGAYHSHGGVNSGSHEHSHHGHAGHHHHGD